MLYQQAHRYFKLRHVDYTKRGQTFLLHLVILEPPTSNFLAIPSWRWYYNVWASIYILPPYLTLGTLLCGSAIISGSEFFLSWVFDRGGWWWWLWWLCCKPMPLSPLLPSGDFDTTWTVSNSDAACSACRLSAVAVLELAAMSSDGLTLYWAVSERLCEVSADLDDWRGMEKAEVRCNRGDRWA